MNVAKPARIIRDPEFAKRLENVCDAHQFVPPKHGGRLTWIQRGLAEPPLNERVSIETIRKWLSGEVKPRPDKLAKLARLLEQDVAWLSLGINPGMEPRERRARNAMADGVVNVVAGLIQMDGGSPAFPLEEDTVAQDNHVDLHAIIKGAKYDLHISLAEVDGQDVRFQVPQTYQTLVVLGVVKRGFDFQIVELPSELIEAGKRRAGSVEVGMTIDEVGRRKIESFRSRL